MTLNELLENHIDINHHSPATIKSYETAINILRRDLGDISVESIDSKVLQIWKNNVLTRASGETWNNYHRHIKALFASAINTSLLNGKNPFTEVARVKCSNSRLKYCKISEIQSAIVTIKENPSSFPPSWFLVSIIKMLYYSGMRRRQIVGLNWADIDEQNDRLRLSSMHSKTKKEWDIPITKEINQLFKEARKSTRLIGGKTSGNRQIFNITIFNNRYNGDRMTVEQLSGMFNRLRRKGYTLSAHKLRHTMATEICNGGRHIGLSTDLRVLQQQLGHSDITSTSVYVHPSIEAQANMLSKLRKI